VFSEICSNGLFPNGIYSYLVGSIIIGTGMGIVFLMTGITAGVSRVFTNLLSFVSQRKFFHTSEKRDARGFNVVLIVGLILGALIYNITVNQGQCFVTEVQWWRLLAGGLLVGFGTRLGRGCTSGHGICGISAGSGSSVVSTSVFVGVGIVVALITGNLGILP
jgi:uncharacterized membrane protein YedE/YeeE